MSVYEERALAEPQMLTTAPVSLGRAVWRRFMRHRMALFGLGVMAVLTLLAIFAPWVAPYSPTHMDFTALLQPPSLHHLMGTDALGHDVLTQWLYGGRYSLFIGLSTTVVMVLVGTPLGAIAGYFGGFVDNILMRLTDLLLTFPVLLLQIALAAQMGGKQSVALIIILIAGFSWMVPARLIRGEVLSLKGRDFVSAARAVGASDWRVIFRHLMPNAIAPMLVSATLNIGGAIVTEAALSFLGMGVQPPTPTWGNMIGFNQNNAMTAPWLILFPGFAVVLTVLAVNFIGDGIRDALDPTAMVQK